MCPPVPTVSGCGFLVGSNIMTALLIAIGGSGIVFIVSCIFISRVFIGWILGLMIVCGKMRVRSPEWWVHFSGSSSEWP